ncbi:MAG: hypothetical protein GF307_13845 [candidate division Zixibacteria bacterium]|nr:hypothetical protein [candidate division Zixibacteria bacterium]
MQQLRGCNKEIKSKKNAHYCTGVLLAAMLLSIYCAVSYAQMTPSPSQLEQLSSMNREQLQALKDSLENEAELAGGGVPDSALIQSLLKKNKKKFSVLPSDTADLGRQELYSEGDSLEFYLDSLLVLEDSLQDTIRFFGYDIFNLIPGTFQPPDYGPVSEDYLVGPGDEVILTVWGDTEIHESLKVSREGYLLLPDAGRMLVNGLTIEGLRDKVTNRLSKIYSGIKKSPGKSTTFVDVSLGKLRSMKVFLMGEVKRPGGYTISAVSNAFNALYYAGGPTYDGTMRNIKIMRNNKLIAAFDLYDYLLGGDNSDDVRLENGDIIFVGTVGERSTIAGEVKRPGIYEIQDKETLKDLLAHCGGLKSTAYLKRAQITRVVPFEYRGENVRDERQTVDVNLEDVLAGREVVEIFDNDSIMVFPVGDELKNCVYIAGDVVRKPGRYELRSGMKLSDLIREADSLKGDVYWDYGHVIRTNDDESVDIVSFNLKDALNGLNRQDISLVPRDSVRVYSIWDFEQRYTVNISGSVWEPGEYNLYGGMGLRDLIVMAGGFKDCAYKDTIEVSRLLEYGSGSNTKIIKIPTTPEYLDGKGDEIIDLQKHDRVFVRKCPSWEPLKNVSIRGEVKFPGEYTLKSDDETLLDLIQRAGGLTDFAYPAAAVFTRNKNNTGRLAIDLKEVLEDHDSKYNLKLVEGDELLIPEEPKTVKVVGEVNYPTAVLYVKGKDFKYYIEQAGGAKPAADKGKVSVVMANGMVKRPKTLATVKPDAGSTIIVPEKLEKDHSQTLKDVASIIGIVSSAATTVFLIKQSTR